MSKETNIFDLYSQLNKAGQRGEAHRHIANLCGVTVGTVKNHWFLNRELPKKVQEQTQNEIILFLQKQIALTNNISVN